MGDDGEEEACGDGCGEDGDRRAIAHVAQCQQRDAEVNRELQERGEQLSPRFQFATLLMRTCSAHARDMIGVGDTVGTDCPPASCTTLLAASLRLEASSTESPGEAPL